MSASQATENLPEALPRMNGTANLELGRRFKFPSLAIGVAVIAGPMEVAIPPVVVGLVVARAALPTWKRTLDKIRRKNRTDADLLDSLWILFHTLTGEFFAPALAILLTEGGNTLRDATAMAGERRKPEVIPNRQYWIERKGRRRLVLSQDLCRGDWVLLGPGDRVPADGISVRGEGLFDQTVLTGASALQSRREGDEVFASTVLVRGKLVLEIQRLGNETRASQLAETVHDKSREDTRISNYAKELGNLAVIPAITASALVFAVTGNVPKALAPLQLDFAQGVAVGAPIPVLASLQHAAASRVLIRGGHALEQLARIDAVIFDKTGTLTENKSQIVAVEVFRSDVSEDELLACAASASYYVLQPFSVALNRYASDKGIAVEPSDPADYSDAGVVAHVGGREVVVGTNHFLEQRGIAFDPEYHRTHKGVIINRSIRYVARDGQLLGTLFHTNPLRPESATTIQTLQALGIRSYLVTGDSSQAANAIAYKLGIRPGDTFAQASAEHKVEVLEKLRTLHKAVAYVGDGVNDAPAMSRADVAVSFRHASDLARETADVVLLDDDLRGLCYAIARSRDALGLVHQNIAAVTAANVAAVLGGVFFDLSALGSVLINNGSTVLAGLNGLRPLLSGERTDPDIQTAVVRDDRGLLGVPWRKRQRGEVGRLFQSEAPPGLV